MSVHDATPGDVYRDPSGALWQVVAVCHEPTVTVAKLSTEPDEDFPVRQGGGVSGLMWAGFVKLEDSRA